MRRILALGAMLLTVSAVLAGCGGDGDDSGDDGTSPIEIDLVVIASLTGDATTYGVAQNNGILLAVEELAGDDVTFDVETLDDASDAETGAEAMRQAVDAGASVVLGPTLSPVAEAVDPIAVDAGIPVLAVTNSTLDLSGLDTVWRICKSEQQQIDATVRWASVGSEPMEAALLVDAADGYALGAAEAFETSAGDAGWSVTRFEADGPADAAPTAAEALATDPDILLIAARSDSAIAFGEATVDFDGQRLGGNGFNSQEVLDAGGAALEGIAASASWNLANGTSVTPEFVASYTERFGVEPDAFAAQGYAAVQVLVAAARATGSAEPEALQSALGELAATKTLLGSFEFDDERSPTYPAVVQIVVSGVLVPATGLEGT